MKQIRQLINSRTETEYLIKNLCVEVCTCECRCQERPEVSAASLGAGAGVSREPPHGGAGNWAQVLCKSSEYSLAPLLSLPSTEYFKRKKKRMSQCLLNGIYDGNCRHDLVTFLLEDYLYYHCPLMGVFRGERCRLGVLAHTRHPEFQHWGGWGSMMAMLLEVSPGGLPSETSSSKTETESKMWCEQQISSISQIPLQAQVANTWWESVFSWSSFVSVSNESKLGKSIN